MENERKKKPEGRPGGVRQTAARVNGILEDNGHGQSSEYSKGKNILEPKRVEEIISSGTVFEKAILLVTDKEMRKNYHSIRFKLTQEEKLRLGASLTSKEQKDELIAYTAIYDSLVKYGNNIAHSFKIYQLAASNLARLLDRLDIYEGMAEALTKAIRNGQEPNLEEVSSCNPYKEVAFLYVPEDGKVMADISIEKGLYKKIKEASEKLKNQLSSFKAFIETIWDYILDKNYLPITPYLIRNIHTNVMEERYLRSIIKNPRYFKSELNHRKTGKDKPVTEGEKRLAVIPDYSEIEEDKFVAEFLKRTLK